MRRFLIILFCTLSIHIYAADYAPFAGGSAAVPVATMQSVNNSGYMTSGSSYTSTVYDVDSSSPSRAGARKAPPSITPGTTADDDPSNTNYGTIGDAVIPLLIMVMIYAMYVLLYRRKTRTMS